MERRVGMGFQEAPDQVQQLPVGNARLQLLDYTVVVDKIEERRAFRLADGQAPLTQIESTITSDNICHEHESSAGWASRGVLRLTVSRGNLRFADNENLVRLALVLLFARVRRVR